QSTQHYPLSYPTLFRSQVAVPRDQQQRIALVGGGDVVLSAGDDPPVAFLACGGGHVVAVGPRVRFGQRERHLQRAVGDARQPLRLHVRRAVLVQDRTADRGRDDRDEQRHAVCRQLLDDDGEL